MKFMLIGDGGAAQYHRKAIEFVGGNLNVVVDPKYFTMNPNKIDATINKNILWADDLCSIPETYLAKIDYFVIASPSHLHRKQIKFLLKQIDNGYRKTQIICEKPAFLPWEIPILDDRINIVLQLRYLENLPEKAALIIARFNRNKEYFLTWKGDPKKTGGLFFALFIHYLDLAILLHADFRGYVSHDTKNERFIGTKLSWPEEIWSANDKYIKDCDKIDILKIDMQSCYNRMYEAILQGNGIKPEDLFYLNWVLQRNSEIFGYGKNGINKSIKIDKELL